jgi:tetratricopeptide (TPR) repeat protein
VTALACFYIILRAGVFKFMLPEGPVEVTVLQRMPGNFVALLHYLKHLVWPFDLHMEYGEQVFAWGYYKTLIGMAVFACFIVLAVRNREKKNPVFFSILWFFAALLPFSNIYAINAYMAEHWLYLPSIGFFIVLAWGISLFLRREKTRNASLAASACLLVFYSALTVRQNSYWRDPFAFYNRTIKYVKDSEVVYNNLAVLYGEKGEYQKAIELFKKSIEINPRYADSYFNMGKAYNSLGMRGEAVRYYERGVELYKDRVKAGTYYNIGNIYKDMRNHERAIYYYRKALEENPEYVHVYNNMALTYFDMEKNKEALRLLERAIELDPGDPYAYTNIAAVYYYIGKYDQAMEYFNKARSLGMVNKTLKEALEKKLKKE